MDDHRTAAERRKVGTRSIKLIEFERRVRIGAPGPQLAACCRAGAQQRDRQKRGEPPVAEAVAGPVCAPKLGSFAQEHTTIFLWRRATSISSDSGPLCALGRDLSEYIAGHGGTPARGCIRSSSSAAASAAISTTNAEPTAIAQTRTSGLVGSIALAGSVCAMRGSHRYCCGVAMIDAWRVMR